MAIYEIQEDGTEKQLGSGSGASVNQGTQWYSGVIPSETGENLSSTTVTLEAGKRYKVGVASENAGEVEGKDMQVGLAWVTPSQKQANIDNAILAAENNDTVVIFAYAQVSDPADTREETTLKLSDDQQNMILDVAKAAHQAGNKVAVVLNNDSAVVMEDWIDEVDAILEMYYPGQRGGVATAKLLTGEVNPSGKLAYTIPKKDTDTIITYSEESWSRFEQEDESEEDTPGNDMPGGPGGFPGFARKDTTTYFDEGINTGYKWYDEMDIEPQFDFGYGLSYTTFAYSDMEVAESLEAGESAGYDVTFTVTNTGDVAGSEVAQVYLGEAQVPEGIQTSKYALAGYEKVKDLEPGESREVTIHVSERSLSYWNSNQEALNVNSDGTKDKWTVAEGKRTIYVGAASDNLLMHADVQVKERNINQEDLDQAVKEAEEAKEKAEAAQEAAETAKAEAETAKAEAETAKAEAEAAKGEAEAAKEEANQAKTDAQEAQLKAEAAEAKAQAAQAKAEAAQTKAEAAVELAEAKVELAEAAQKAAEAAQARAEAAEADAEDAKKEAEAAQKAAEKAQKEAEKAVDAANEKLEAAEEAQKKAEAAQAKAEAAQKAAEEAQRAAEEAQKAAQADSAAAREAMEAAQKAASEERTAAQKAIEEANKAQAEAAKVLEKASFIGKQADIKKVTGKKKQMKVTVKKVSGASGYEVQYSTKASFRKAATKKLTKNSVTIKKLKSKKKYYVRVRAYKIIDGEKVYTGYSARKTVRVK